MRYLRESQHLKVFVQRKETALRRDREQDRAWCERAYSSDLSTPAARPAVLPAYDHLARSASNLYGLSAVYKFVGVVCTPSEPPSRPKLMMASEKPDDAVAAYLRQRLD